MSKEVKFFLLLFGDLAILFFSLWATLRLRFGDVRTEIWESHVIPFGILFFIWVTVFFIAGLYDPKKAQRGLGYWAQIVTVMFWNAAIAVIFFYLLSIPRLVSIRPFRVLAIEVGLATIFLLPWRDIMQRIFTARALATNLLLLGDTPLARETATYVKQHPSLGYQLVGILQEGETKKSNPYSPREVPNDLETFVREHDIRCIVSALDLHRDPELTKDLFRLFPARLRFQRLEEFYEDLTGKVPVTAIEEVWFLENMAETRKRLFEVAKRLFDIVVAILGLLLTLLLGPIIALLVVLDSKGPIFYFQDRVGKNGRILRAVKFRSMIADAEKEGPQWATPDDPRITPVGKFLRKTRLNELPQFWNVFKGEMSLIGPRPERPWFVKDLQEEIPFYNERHLVKPGLTGWAQVNFRYGASKEDALEKLQYDLFYIKNRSFVLELSILLKTIKTIISGAGW
ncbi:sugar transferase [Candidatus Azambacteria bacterium]|nr:sugar transferase [Candidatus Azambacteria bacterium]